MSEDIGSVDLVAGDATTLRVMSGFPESARSRASQLTEQVYAVIVALNDAVQHGDAVIVVDFRMEPAKGGAAYTNANAYLEAVRGLVQSLTLELSAPSPAVNVVVSTDAEARDRDRTIRYLHSEDGRFSRGTTYDLRSVK